MATNAVIVRQNDELWTGLFCDGRELGRFPFAPSKAAQRLSESGVSAVFCGGVLTQSNFPAGALRLTPARMDKLDNEGQGSAINIAPRAAFALAQALGIPAYALACCHQSMPEDYGITGLREIVRRARFDAFHLQSVADAAFDGHPPDAYIIADVGAYTTVAAYRGQTLRFVNDTAALEGPMGLTSAGDLPLRDVIRLAKAHADLPALKAQLCAEGGLSAYGVDDPAATDAQAPIEALAFATAKWIGRAAIALDWQTDAVVVSTPSTAITKRLVAYADALGMTVPINSGDVDALAFAGRRTALLGTAALPLIQS